MKRVCVCLAVAGTLCANPENPVVISGDAAFAASAQLLEVTASNRAVIEWQRFSIDAAETVRFLQPSEMAVVLNRVTGMDVSTLSGRLEANGTVYLINPRGVIASAGAVVDTAGFLATTLDVDNGEFLAGGDVLFTGSSDASVVQQGIIRARNGDIILMAHHVRHEGALEAHQGSVALVAGHEVLVKPAGMPLLTIRPDLRALSVENTGSIEALQAYVLSDGISRLGALRQEGEIALVQKGGKIVLSNSTAVAEVTKTAKLTAPQGEISVSGGDGALYNMGTFDVSGDSGGTITISANYVSTGSTMLAEGHQGPGGAIAVTATDRFFEIARGRSSVQGTAAGGTISVSTPHLFSSGTHEASRGEVRLLGDMVTLAGAQITGHEIVLGGSDVSTPASEVSISRSTLLSGNQVHTWALQTVSNPTSGVTPFPAIELIDPHAGVPVGSGGPFGQSIVVLSNGNVVVTKPGDTVNGVLNAGSVFIYDGTTGQLMSILSGSHTDDQVGASNVVPLLGGNPNCVVCSPEWNNQRGAATLVSGTAAGGNTTFVSATNSLVGSTGGMNADFVGSRATALNNGHYVVQTTSWSNGFGAATWGHGTTGVTGTVSVANSLVGSPAAGSIGQNVFLLNNNDNYVVGSPNSNSLTGAATWSPGNPGITGTVSLANSLLGSTAGDLVGVGLTALANGHYVTFSPFWNTNAGAVTWGNGTQGVTGTVSSSHSLIGSTSGGPDTGDHVGFSVTALTDPGNTGNYVVNSANWNGLGAATWSSGNPGITGTVSVSNSLTGSVHLDGVALNGIVALTNGHYVVKSSAWNMNIGAATWGNGTQGITGTVSISNSLIGTTNGDQIGQVVTPLVSNGNYVVGSPNWFDQAIPANEAGAATWSSGNPGITGTVSVSNSLTGTTFSDRVGIGILALKTNGHYVVGSPLWNDPSSMVGFVGAVTWGNGTQGITGTVSSANSLIGSFSPDQIGSFDGFGTFDAIALNNGNYVIPSSLWNSNIGAATWGHGSGGTTGTVSIANSLIGSTSGDKVGTIQNGNILGLIAVGNGNYVVASDQWSNPAGNTLVGAVTWGNGTAGVTGTISSANSVIGTLMNDRISSADVTPLTGGNYVIGSDMWDNSTGAATYGFGSAGVKGLGSSEGVTGTVSIANSVIGDETGACSSGCSLDFVLDNAGLPGTFVVSFDTVPQVFIVGVASPPPSPTPSPSPPSAATLAAARIQYARAIAESFTDWNTRWFGPYLSDDPWAPIYTTKGLLVNLPSLVLDSPWEEHTLLQTK